MPLECDALKIKCQTRSAVEELVQKRLEDPNNLGSFGPVVFEDAETFLQRFPQEREAMPVSTVEQIIVIGDVHGDFLSFVTALRLADVLDETYQLTSSPRSRIVVQMGDLIDRKVRQSTKTTTSTNPREELDLIQFIYFLDCTAHASPHKNTRLVSLAGNHDIYNFGGNDKRHLKQFSDIAFRYTTPITNEGFGGIRGRSRFFSLGSGAGSLMGATRPIILQVKNWIFVHGGLHYKVLKHFQKSFEQSQLPLVALLNTVYAATMSSNQKVLQQLADQCSDETLRTELRMGILPQAVCTLVEYRADQGARPPEDDSCKDLTLKLGSLFDLQNEWTKGHGGVCVSHTPQEEGINGTCGQLVFRVDVGLSESFGRKNPETGYPFSILAIDLPENQVASIEATRGGSKVKILRK